MLSELDLITLQVDPLAVAMPAVAGRTELERSPAFRAYAERLRDGLAYLEAPARRDAPRPVAAAVA